MKHPRSLLRPWRAALVAITIGSIAASSRSASNGDVAFADYGKKFVKAHCKGEGAECPFATVREQSYVHGVLGAFDFAYPAAFLSEKDKQEELRTIANGLLDLQTRWIDWLTKSEPAAATAKTDIGELKAWVKGWKLPSLAKAASAPSKDLFALTGASDAVKAAAGRVTAFVTSTDSMGVAPKTGQPVSILFSPSRHDFVELLGYAGTLDPAQQASLWNKNATTWGTFWIEQTIVVGLTYPVWRDDPEFKADLEMTSKDEPSGLLQCVVQQAMNALLWACYGESDAAYLTAAVSRNMAIAVCGELNALEGDSSRGTTGAHTDPYEKFVPGGASSGGTLPPMPAAPLDQMKVNQWRATKGRDHFTEPLRKGQKNGLRELGKNKEPKLDASLTKDKTAHFLLVGTDPSQKYVVTAPFLGSHAKEKPYPPPEVIIDYKEFFRAYSSAFYHWLQAQGDAKGAEPSAQKYSALLKALETRPAEKSFDDAVKEIYGVPISDKNGDVDSLEWRFLKWLDKGK
jgi:hypothetical protein